MKKVKLLLFALVVSLMTSTTVLAESKWDTMQPVKQTTSDGIKIEYQTKFEYILDCWYENYCDKIGVDAEVDVTVTIPQNYDKETIVIAPEVLQELAKQNYEALKLSENSEYLQLNGALEPGDNIKVNLTIINNSKYTYNYDELSFDIFPVENQTFTRGEENTTFNGLNFGDKYIIYRLANPALKDLGLRRNSDVTDEKIDAALKKVKDSAGNQLYPNGIKDLAKYYLNYYNNKYNTNHTRLDQFSYGVIREILGYNDTIDRVSTNKGNFPYLNAQYKIYEANYKAAFPGKRAYQDAVLEYAGFSKANGFNQMFADFAMDTYSKMCGQTVTSLDTMCTEAQDEFFGHYGSEAEPMIFETNEDILTLSYDYFYNKGLSFGIEDDDVTDANSNNYSVGEYMRDEEKGEEKIKEKIGTIKSNTKNSLKSTFYINGAYICNAYLGYNFMTNMQLSYSALKGVLVVNYLTTDGEKLTDEITTIEMVGKNYKTDLKHFDGYTFITVDGEVEGTYIDGVLYVTYYYDKYTGTGNIEPPQTGLDLSNLTHSTTTNNLYRKEDE